MAMGGFFHDEFYASGSFPEIGNPVTWRVLVYSTRETNMESENCLMFLG